MPIIDLSAMIASSSPGTLEAIRVDMANSALMSAASVLLLVVLCVNIGARMAIRAITRRS